MHHREILHLSIPVADLMEAKRFYVEVLQARAGRQTDAWLDVLLWGHQITLQHRPDEVRSLAEQGRRHFGVSLPWDEWEALANRIRSLGVGFLSQPTVLMKGSPQEHAKFYVADPSNNVIEIKAYRDIVSTLRFDGEG